MELSYWKLHPFVHAGIMECRGLEFVLNGQFRINGIVAEGKQKAAISGSLVEWNGQKGERLLFEPQSAECSFTLRDVTIGIDYHWQRKLDQRFKGSLELLADGGKMHAINIVFIEDYLTSVISSEMSATASLEFLKASAIISRSWLLKQIENRLEARTNAAEKGKVENENETIVWSDRQDHRLFDVCADDHCQRYQGIQMASNPNVSRAIGETSGQVLFNNNEICDARFSKCCGGISEEFDTCWEYRQMPYLQAVSDSKDESIHEDLTQESSAEKWIRGNAPAFCNTNDKSVLSQVLNDYDQETTQFYRWQVEYSQEQISRLLSKKTGIDFGNILDLKPLARGKSGRIWKLEVIGSKKSHIFGKELEIRRILSETHLFSSAFLVERNSISGCEPQTFRLLGAGWGHGVGMCQIGAAVMGAKGCNYKQILLHYYKGTQIKQLY